MCVTCVLSNYSSAIFVVFLRVPINNDNETQEEEEEGEGDGQFQDLDEL